MQNLISLMINQMYALLKFFFCEPYSRWPVCMWHEGEIRRRRNVSLKKSVTEEHQSPPVHHHHAALLLKPLPLPRLRLPFPLILILHPGLLARSTPRLPVSSASTSSSSESRSTRMTGEAGGKGGGGGGARGGGGFGPAFVGQVFTMLDPSGNGLMAVSTRFHLPHFLANRFANTSYLFISIL
jgi:uncharacterized membrane protein YgcG